MNRPINNMVLGGLVALMLAGVGLFWLQGQAQVERGAPPPEPDAMAQGRDPDTLPVADIAGMEGPEPPEATDLSREERRFFRYDRNRDRRITRNEMLATRTDAFRKLDKDGNNLLTFEEWAVATVERFEGMDANGNDELTEAEFATSAPSPDASSRPRCDC